MGVIVFMFMHLKAFVHPVICLPFTADQGKAVMCLQNSSTFLQCLRTRVDKYYLTKIIKNEQGDSVQVPSEDEESYQRNKIPKCYV